MPKIHPREQLVQGVEVELRVSVAKAVKDLTLAEATSVISRVLSGEIVALMKYEIRQERHGNTDKPGGWA